MLTQEILKEFFHYNPETGVFTRAKTWYGKPKNSAVGMRHSEGYLYTTIRTRKHFLHRLAFLYMEGYLPEHQVDHINGTRDDNRWCNLRHASVTCQRQNNVKLSTNTTGYKGVSFNETSGKWGAQIIVNEKHYWLGSFDCPLEAALTRITFEDWCPKWSCDARDWNREKVFADLQKAITEQDTSKWIFEPKLSQRNTTGYVGVKFDKRAKKNPYKAQVNINKVRYDLGGYSTALEAHEARIEFLNK